jgi:hypothetical protein
MQPESTVKTELAVRAGETAAFAFALTPTKPVREMMHTRVYVVSKGAFGLVAMNLLYGRAMHDQGELRVRDTRQCRQTR